MSKIRMASLLAAAGAGVTGLVLMAQAQQGDDARPMQQPPATAPAEPAPAADAPEAKGDADAATIEGFDTLKDQASYAMGVGYATQMKQQLQAQEEMDVNQFAAGFGEAWKGGDLKLTPEQMSYAAGATVSQGIKKEIAADTTGQVTAEQFAHGFQAAMGEGEAKLSMEQVQQTMNAFQQRMMERQIAEMGGDPQYRNPQGGEEKVAVDGPDAAAMKEAREAAEREQQQVAKANQDKADKFLAENKNKEGVKSTPGGVQYIVLEPGKGETPDPADVVTVHYTGKLLDGTTFDTSHKARPQPTGGMYPSPLTMPLGDLIPGWHEGLAQIKEGGKVRLFIPPALAYGEDGPPTIGPNQLLIFDIDLLDVQKLDAGQDNARTPPDGDTVGGAGFDIE